MQEEFLLFINNISLYPTIIFTGLVLFVTLYWVVSLIGMADMDTIDIGDINADLGADVGGDTGGDVSSTGLFTGLLLKFGLYGVPLIVILTLISLIGWVLSYIYTSFLHQWLSSGPLYYAFGTGAFILVLVVSMWLTGIIISPIRKNIAKIPKRNAASNIGKIATVRTLTVTDKHGEAELSDGGAGLILKIRQFDEDTQPLKQGDAVVLIEYLQDANAYRVAPAKESIKSNQIL
ncbi:OB-fold-containig protein [Psychrobacter sp. I-STPA10]|uniref:OB-fold-containig protein n=1 Tax=Psychrobacter sp. I-STPA10 TaxID=2585769 RepID=UPI001E428B4B|nr:OB-fold-containig protein [Psychrobacter sp. I-STPA10]